MAEGSVTDGNVTLSANVTGAGLGAAPLLNTLVAALPVSSAASAAAPSNPGSPSAVTGYSVDATRQWIAFVLLGILGAFVFAEVLATVVLAFDCWVGHDGKCTQEGVAMDLLTRGVGGAFTAIVGLVGSVVGFYFGSQSQKSP